MKFQNFKYIPFVLILLSSTTMAMLKALNTAATGMAAQEMNVNTISNNITNINTTGFKRQRAEFEDLPYENIKNAGGKSRTDTLYSSGIQIGSGTKVSSVHKEFFQGNPQITNNPFDLMVSDGDGFFGIITNNQQMKYTRNGSFNVSNKGFLVNSNGFKVAPGFQLPPNSKSVNISRNGEIEVFLNNEIQPLQIGQILLFTFINPVGLRSIGQNLYQETRSSGRSIENIPGDNQAGFILQGALEMSNVSIMNEMTSLIKAQRAYEMNSKVMSIIDKMSENINNIL